MKSLKILYLEDTSFDVDLVKRVLSEYGMDYSLKQSCDRQSYINDLNEFDPDIVLSDHTLHQFDSLEALNVLQELKKNIPFILVTGTVSEEFAVTILKKGANDYILKKNLSRLPIAILNSLKEKKSETEKWIYQNKLEEKNKELSTLIYKLTHDLRGPVCSVLGLIDIAEKEGTKNEYLDKIYESTKKLDFILHSLIDTMYTKDAETVREKVNFKHLIKEILKKFEYIEEFRKVTVSFNVNNDTAFYSDKKIMSSILQNLIENAFKYQNHSIHDSYIKISVNTNEQKAIIEIEDNGIGIDTEIKDKIFNMFFRGTNDSKGSGLGLYIVKNGIEKLNGEIELSAEPKRGTSFVLSIPNCL